jgi:hypothetical protein
MNHQNRQSGVVMAILTAAAVFVVFMGWFALQPALRAMGIVFHAVP